LEISDWRMSIEVRRARLADVPGVADLVGRFAGRGEVLPRSEADVYQSMREWVVAAQSGRIIGCGGLVILWADLAEIRSLVVDPAYRGQGIGRQLVQLLLSQAVELEIPQVIALTRKPGFFRTLGFRIVPRESLPRKIWKDCVTCTKFVGCDEVAVVREVDRLGSLEGWEAGKLSVSSHAGTNGTDLAASTLQPSHHSTHPSPMHRRRRT
jgi:amino-acid N-acetyltransferase